MNWTNYIIASGENDKYISALREHVPLGEVEKYNTLQDLKPDIDSISFSLQFKFKKMIVETRGSRLL